MTRLYLFIKNLQHRGRESSGISYLIITNGVISWCWSSKDVYANFNYNEHVKSVIGHNRYSTSGKPKTIMEYNEETQEIEDTNCKLHIQPFYDSSFIFTCS